MAFDWMSYILAKNMQDAAIEAGRVDRDDRNSYLAEIRGDKKAELDRLDKKEAARKATGEAGRGAYISNVKQRVSSGLVGEESAQKLVQDYYADYDLTPATDELTSITDAYQQFVPKQRAIQLSALYQRNVGRPATADELTTRQSEMGSGGRTIGDIEQDIQASAEYKNQRPSSAEEAKNEAIYGRPVLDPVTGLRTKTYKSYFSKTALPGVSDDLQKQIGIKAPSFIGEEFIGTADEIEYAKTQRNNYETFLYNSGLTALKGNLDKEISKYAQDQETERTGKNVKGQIDIEGIRQTGQKAISDFSQLEETRRTDKVVAGQKDVEDIRVRGQKEITEQTIKGDIRRNREQQAYGLLQGVVGSFNF